MAYHFGEVDPCALEECRSDDGGNGESVANPFLGYEESVLNSPF